MENNILFYIGIINLIISIAVCIVLIIKKEKTKGFLLLFFMILCPVIGPGFLLFSWCFRILLYKKEVDIGDLSFHREELNMIIGPDFNKEIDAVPIEEALIVSNNNNKRRVILDVLKEDYNNSLTVITNALESDDSETSHYVATVIADVKSNFKVTVQKMQENLKKYPDDADIYCILIDYIHSFLEKDVLSEIEEMTYIEQYVQLMGKLFLQNKKAITSKMYKNIIDHLLKVGNSSEALLWGQRAITECPNELDTYKGNLKLYYEIDDKGNFFDILKRMKESNVEFDNESLELIRFYQV
ncbi:MAG: hypothetical protein ACOWWH_04080 [Eubacteriaceae bacterium]